MAGYVELHAHSYFSFRDGASSPEDLLQRAKELGMETLALTDHSGLYGAVRFAQAAKTVGLHPIFGAELSFQDGTHLTLLVENSKGWSNLARLISMGQLAGEKEEPLFTWELIADHSQGLICLSGCQKGEIPIALLQHKKQRAASIAKRYLDVFGPERYFFEVQHHLLPPDDRLVRALSGLADEMSIPMVATNDVHYANPEGYRLHDILTAIGCNCSLDELGGRRRPNGEYYLKSRKALEELLPEEGLRATLKLAERCNFTLDFGEHLLPRFPAPQGQSTIEYLRSLCYQALKQKYQLEAEQGVKRLEHELGVIERLHLADYFLLVWDIVRFAREKGILCQGRGSSANSIVAYLLEITRVDPIGHDLLFERFLSEERGCAPDIDLDFASSRREEVIRYVNEKYGAEHAAMVCELVTYRARSAIRDVGKALGFPQGMVDQMAKSVDPWGTEDIPEALARNWQFREHLTSLPYKELLEFTRALAGFPDHLSIHVGGMVITGKPLIEICPVERATMPGRMVLQWDKDDVEDAGLIKVDLLSLRTLSVIDDALGHINQHYGRKLDPFVIPQDDPQVFAMLKKGDIIGVFQVESRAQYRMTLLTLPDNLDDLIRQIALVRPGPIEGGMVRTFIRRRLGKEPVTYIHPSLEPILKESLGTILYQEQVLKVAVAIADFTPGEAEMLRRAMGRKRSREEMERFRERFVRGAGRKGITAEVADRVFNQLAAFADYGFCKSHAASFALLTYLTAYLKRYYPLAFYCAILNNQPMGYYTPDVVLEDAKRHRIPVLPADVNASQSEFTIEGQALRVGLEYVQHLGEAHLQRIEVARREGPFRSLQDFCCRTHLPKRAVESLILVGAFDNLHDKRRELLWWLQAWRPPAPSRNGKGKEGRGFAQLMLFDYPDHEVAFDPLTGWERTVLDYQLLSLTPGVHVASYYRQLWQDLGIITAQEVKRLPPGTRVRVAGLRIDRRQPPTAYGTAYLALEDETGIVNVTIPPVICEAYWHVTRHPLILVEGQITREQRFVNVEAERLLEVPIPPPKVESLTEEGTAVSEARPRSRQLP